MFDRRQNTQTLINALARLVPRLCFGNDDLEFRLTGRLLPLLRGRGHRPWRSGNGFLMEPITDNPGYITGSNERSYITFLANQLAGVDGASQGDGVIVNVGANVGYTILFLAHALGRRHGFAAVEPFAPTCERLRANLELNGVECAIHQVAASDNNGHAKFYANGSGDGAASLHPRDNADEIIITTQRLDELIPIPLDHDR